jgi:hypothetical protein
VRRATLTLTLMAGLVAAAGSASAGGLDVRIGGFFPTGSDTYQPDANPPVFLFGDLNDLYTPNASQERGVRAKDFRGVYGGIEYNTVVAPYVEVGISLDGYGRTLDTSYRYHVREEDQSEIEQRLKLSMVPLGFTVRLLPTSKKAAFVPYVGAGLDVIFYSYEETGDFIDFQDPTSPVYSDSFRDTGAMLGAHAVGGLRVYLNRDVALVGEVRYQFARKDMGGDFSNYRLDMSGASFTVGMHVRF